MSKKPLREDLSDVPDVGYATYLNKNATTQIRPPGPIPALLRVTVNTKGAGGNTLTLYDGDGASSPVIAIIDTTAASFPLTLDYKLRLLHGILTAVLATGTAADVTIVTS